MIGEDDPSSKTNKPFGLSDSPSTGGYQLPQVVKGRMLCTSHGQVCYRRISYTGEKKWICPDERHRKPILDS